MAIYASKVFVRPPVKARAESTELIEQTLGVKVLPDKPGRIYHQAVTKHRPAGNGKYCPVID